ncbi:unnamed protein product [Clonostachys rosea]|uniref:Integral membrane protein n=1 Tax=Bionectria ochroleuca TaxID=29856 RepID=A0ABY6TXU5_BIOOC|nr:unnamed protein product [Clonostachys rosea]
MASQLLSPKATTLLLTTPLISSSCSLWFSLDQHCFFSNLVKPNVRGADEVLPPYFANTFWANLWKVVGLLGVTTWSSVGAIYLSRPLLRARGSFPWYVATAALATGHLFFVPLVAPSVAALIEDRGHQASSEAKKGKGKSNSDYMRDWLGVNLVRMVTADLGAWVCAVVAVTTTFALP